VGNDKATVDAIDVVSNCETVDGQAAGGGPSGSGGATPGTGTPSGGVKKPAASCKVPKKLKGLTLASARKKLRAAHCTTIKTRRVKSRAVRKGRVVTASRKGRTVTVSVSRGRR
jgi:hypothetical protein